MTTATRTSIGTLLLGLVMALASVTAATGQSDPELAPPRNTLVAATGHTCALTVDGLIECWGLNMAGESDDQVRGEWVSVASATFHTCAVTVDGDIDCFGDDRYGEAVDRTDADYVDVDVALFHTCGITSEGELRCWGNDTDGQAPASQPGPYVQVATGQVHTCALTPDGTIDCWGDNRNGPLDVPDGRFLQVDVGNEFTCALRVDQFIDCWGLDDSGQTQDQDDFTSVQVSTGSDHACAVATDGAVECWGDNGFGAAEDQRDGSFAAVSAGGGHTCALTEGGSTRCWGQNRYGQVQSGLGPFRLPTFTTNGAPDPAPTPTPTATSTPTPTPTQSPGRAGMEVVAVEDTDPDGILRAVDRFAAAADLDTPDCLAVGTSQEFADNLSAASLATRRYDCQLALTDPDNLSAEVADRIDDTAPATVYVLGGPAAVSDDVMDAIRAAGVPNVRRLGGAERVSTSALINREVAPDCGTVLLARATAPVGNATAAFADALTAGVYAAAINAPLQLTATDDLSPAALDYLDSCQPQVVVLIGGLAALSADLEQQIADRYPNATLLRLAGPDRVETSLAISANRQYNSGRSLECVGVFDATTAQSWRAPLVWTRPLASGRCGAVVNGGQSDLTPALRDWLVGDGADPVTTQLVTSLPGPLSAEVQALLEG